MSKPKDISSLENFWIFSISNLLSPTTSPFANFHSKQTSEMQMTRKQMRGGRRKGIGCGLLQPYRRRNMVSLGLLLDVQQKEDLIFLVSCSPSDRHSFKTKHCGF